MSNKQIYQELSKIVSASQNQSEYLEHFYECVRFMRNHMQRKAKERHEDYLNDRLDIVKMKQSDLGKQLTMLNIERLAILAVKESK